MADSNNVQSWLNVAEAGYTSAKRPYDKAAKKAIEWGDVSVKTEELTWTKDGDVYIIVAWVNQLPSGVAISSANKDKVKFPCAFKVELTGKDSFAEQALIKCLEADTEQGKFYSASFSLIGSVPSAKAFVSGSKEDGTELTEKEKLFLSSQFLTCMETGQKFLTQDVLDVAMKKEKRQYNNNNGGGSSEPTTDRFDFRLGKLKELFELKPESTIADLASEIETTAKAKEIHPTNFIALLDVLLK